MSSGDEFEDCVDHQRLSNEDSRSPANEKHEELEEEK